MSELIARMEQLNASTIAAAAIAKEAVTELPLTPEEEDTIVTLVVVIVAVLAAIILLFSMGVFIDCKTQKSDLISNSGSQRKRMRLKMPPLGRAQRQGGFGKQRLDDSKYLATDMCPSGTNTSLDAVV